MAVVYQHRRKDTNEVFYVGIGKTIKRANSRFARNRYWNNIINKANYEVDILINGCSWKEACEIEKGLIKDIGRFDLGLGSLVNMTDGGEGINNLSEDSKKSRLDKIIGSKYKWTKTRKKEEVKRDKYKLKSTDSMKRNMDGNKNPMFNKKHSNEAKEKNRLSQVKNKVVCAYCKKYFDTRNFKKWHGEKCKTKNII